MASTPPPFRGIKSVRKASLFCLQCGTRLAEDALFCQECGCRTGRSDGTCVRVDQERDTYLNDRRGNCPAQADGSHETCFVQNDSVPRQFTMNCPHCGQLLEGTEDLYGLTVECPQCAGGIDIAVPESGTRATTMPFPRLARISVNNTFVWILAFIPIGGRLVEYFVSGVIESKPDELWFITLGLNIGLCALDERMLTKAGHNTKGYGEFVWLIPVYLYKRARNLKQPIWCFVIWGIAFGISLLI